MTSISLSSRSKLWAIASVMLALLLVLAALRSLPAYAQASEFEVLDPEGEEIGTATLMPMDDGVELRLDVDEFDPEAQNQRVVITNVGECREPARIRNLDILTRFRATAFAEAEDEAGFRLETDAVTLEDLDDEDGSALYLVDTEEREVLGCAVLFRATQAMQQRGDNATAPGQVLGAPNPAMAEAGGDVRWIL
ncbi:MAG: hypothetical protein M3220_22105, partial [Chloroflexota bacterium]|nr:hypothetical protein [Chloroflexota bacterium]